MISRLRALSFLVALAAACPGATTLALDGTLRERIRERLQQRQQQYAPAAAERDVSSPITKPGDYSFTIDHAGLARSYLVHVPRSYDPAKPTPLLMAFHGGGGTMYFQADDENYGLISKSESAGFIAVFPNGYSRFPEGKLATWNAGTCCAQARDRNIDDVGFVRAVIANLRRQLDIDARRIYATGMSNGGLLTYRLACELTDVFSAIAAVAATDNTRSCSPTRAIAVLEIHARNDDHVLFNGGAGAGAFRDESKVSDFRSVPETISRWTRQNGCNAPPVRVLEVPGAYCERYSGCRDGVAVQLCVTETGKHSWPGARKVRDGKAPASQAISADDVMWDFFGRR